MAKRLIYAEDVKTEIDNWLECVGYATIGKGLSYYAELLGCVADAPTVDAVEVVHGGWIEYGLRNPQCSICKKFNYETSRFCPHCGARMDGERRCK